MNEYPCAVCGAAHTGFFQNVPVCKTHGEEVTRLYAHRKREIEQSTRKSLLILAESMRTALLDGAVR